MSEYLISIIVPTFNLEKEIDKAFESIKAQTIGFDNLEVIFVDDNSNDSTLNILNSYSDKYDNVKIFKTDENSGYAGKPRNIGLKNSTAEYVLFLDGDDKLLINACEVLYDKILYSDASIVIGGQINVFSDGILQHNPPILSNSEENYFKNVLNHKLLTIRPAISAKLFRKSILIKNNITFPENIPGQDLIFLIDAIINSHSIITLNNFYVYYRYLDNDSISLKLDDDYFYGLIQAYINLAELFEDNNITQNLQEIVFHNHLGFLTEQAITVKYFKETNTNLEEIFNSDLFDRLANKKVFQDNKNFSQYFENMKNGEYNNRELLKTIYENFDFDGEIITQIREIKDEISRLTIKPNKLQEDNAYLRKVNSQLSNELNEIKSSKLWKLKNKF